MSASRSARAAACARPRSVRGRSACPCQRRAWFQSVSPWRASSSVVTPTSCRRLARAVDLGLRDRVCVVTGSTAGIGLETARLLAAEGARVVTSGRREAPEVGEAFHVVADLRRAGEPERVIRDAVDRLGRLDVLVNNVGVARQARFEDVPDEEWNEYWQLNVMSYVRAIRGALPHLRDHGGSIVNVSSTAGEGPPTGRAPF